MNCVKLYSFGYIEKYLVYFYTGKSFEVQGACVCLPKELLIRNVKLLYCASVKTGIMVLRWIK